MKAINHIKEATRAAARRFAPLVWRAWHRGFTSKWQGNSPFGAAPGLVVEKSADYFRDHPSAGKVLMELLPEPKENPIPECQTPQLRESYLRLPSFDGIRVYVYQLQDAVLFGGYAGMVVNKEGGIFEESSPYPWGTLCHPALRRARWPSPSTRLGGKSALLATAEAARNYYHFMVDCLPKVALLIQAGETLDTFERFIINSSTEFAKEIFIEAGIAESKLMHLRPESNLIVDHLVVPEFHGSHDGVEDWQVNKVRELLSAWISTRPATRKIYAVRGDAKVRKVLNEDALIEVLQRQGFEIIDCAKLTAREQVGAFSEATLVVAPHGAALTNLMFCPPGCAAVEIVHPQVVNGFYRNLSRAARLRHHVFAGQGDHAGNLARHRANGADLSINIPELQKFIHEFNL